MAMSFSPGWIGCVVFAGLLSARRLDAGVLESYCTSTVLNTTSSYLNITASSNYDENHAAGEAILNAGAGWVAYNGYTVQWLKVDLGQVWRIRNLMVKTVHSQHRYWYSRDIQIYHSMDGKVWHGYNTALSSHPLGETFQLDTSAENAITNITLSPDITARFITLIPGAYRGHPTLSVELEGCTVPAAEERGGKHVSLDIQIDDIWVPSMSPIIIDRLISVLPTGSLLIEAGVTVVFTSDTAGLKVLGSLEAHGRDGVSVLFTSDHHVIASRGQWLGIEQTQRGVVNMSYVIIRQAVYGLQGTSRLINVSRSSVYSCEAGLQIHEGRTEAASSVLSSSEISYNVIGIQLHGRTDNPHIHITDSVITQNAQHGILVSKWINSLATSTLDTELLIQNCNISGNLRSGVYNTAGISIKIGIDNSSLESNGNSGLYIRRFIYGARTEVNILSSKLNDNSHHGGFINCGYVRNNHSISVTGSDFLSNGRSGLYLSNTGAKDTEVTITIMTNTFSQNNGDFALKMSLSYSRSINVMNNTFRDSKGGVSVTGSTSSNGSLSENLFQNISGEKQSAIRVKGISMNLTYNTLHNITSGSGVHIESGLNHEIKENIFKHVEQLPCLLRIDSEFVLTHVLPAPDNYWGFNSIDVIKSKICDFFLDVRTARVQLERYYSSSTKTPESLTYVHGEDELTYSRGVLGGIIEGRDWNTESGVNMLVNRSIIVGKGATVTIGGNSRFSIAEHRGCVVVGILHIGDDAVGVTVISAFKKTWHGFFVLNGGLTLQNCNINGTETALQTIMGQDNSTTIAIAIANSTVNTTQYGILASACNVNLELSVSSSTIQSSKALSISVLSLDARIKNNTFIGGSIAVYMALCNTSQNDSPLYSRQLDLKNNEFISTSEGEFINIDKRYGVSYTHNIRIVGNHFNSNVQPNSKRNGIRFNLNPDNESLDFLIENNTFSGFRGLCIQHYGAATHLIIRGNVFRNNSRVIYSQLWTSSTSPFHISINKFIDNAGSKDGPVIQLEYGSATHNYIMQGNDLTNNTCRSVVGTSTTNLTVTNNVFDNPDAEYNIELYHNSNPQESGVVNASYNYWGTTDVNLIASKLYDSSFSSDLAEIVFRPYLGSRNISDVQNEERSFVSSSGEIGGAVQGTITLTASDGPYIVTGNVEVGGSDTLVIEAGTELLLRKDVGFTAFGEFLVEGNQTHPVSMTPEHVGVKWRGINLLKGSKEVRSVLTHLIVTDTTDGVVVHGQTALLNSVSSRNSSGHGFTFHLDGSNATDNYKLSSLSASDSTLSGVRFNRDDSASVEVRRVSMSNCRLEHNMEHGISVHGNVSLLFQQCTFENNRKTGIFLDRQHATNMRLEHSVMSMNGEHAISSENARKIELFRNTIQNHDSRYQYFLSTRKRSLLELRKYQTMDSLITISNNMFLNNTGEGIRVYLSSNGGGEFNLTMTSNHFANNVGLLDFTDDSYSFLRVRALDTIVIQNNTFTNNTGNGDSGLLHFGVSFLHSVSVSQNTFRSNSGKHLLLVADGRYKYLNNLGTITVLENVVSDNKVNTTIAIDAYHVTLIRNNIMSSSEAICELSAPAFRNSHFIDARENFWGSADFAVVSSKVCGFDINMLQSFVYYLPFLTSADSNDTLDAGPDVFSLMGVYGGVIDGTFTLPTRIEPYTIRRSIYIRKDSALTVCPGTSLMFERGRGIYTEGSLVIKGSQEMPVTFSGVLNRTWHGIIFNESSGALFPSDLAYLHMSNSDKGITTFSASVNISNSVLSNVSSSGITLSLGQVDALFDFSGTVIENVVGNGILVTKSTGNITLANVTVLNCGQNGIFFKSEFGQLNLLRSTVTNCSRGFDTTFPVKTASKNVTIDRCSFSNHSEYGVKLSLYNVFSNDQITLTRNKFTNNMATALDISFYKFYNKPSSRLLDIGWNEFFHNGIISIKPAINMNVSFHDNIVYGTMATHKQRCFIKLDFHKDRNLPENIIDIQSNLFENISNECVLEITSNERYVFNGTFKYNRLLNNIATEVLALNSANFNFTENVFDNPSSQIDLYVTLEKAEGDVNITAVRNWWGSADPDLVRTRIYDNWHHSELVTVIFEPFLTDPDFDCSDVDDCNSRGECVRPNGCRCDSGWTGLTCSEYECAGVGDCFGHGECIAPNVCNCSEGWTGSRCISATCSGVSECSGHGYCVQPDVCLCAEKFTGSDCSACVSLHWGPACIPCPDCQHGTCDLKTGTCSCDGPNWSGYLCDTCNETFYGPDCLPLMMVLNVLPNSGSDRGGNTVHFRGHNFHETSPPVYHCKFGSEIVEGTWVNRKHVTCVAPAQAEGTVVVDISPNGTSYTDNKLTYTYYATCPPGSCGRDVDPPRGQCLFGGCSCNLPWSGENCSREILPPIIQTPDEFQTIEEATSYSFEPVLLQGSQPVAWSIPTGPVGMAINRRTGRVQWTHAVAETLPHNIEIQAENEVGRAMVSWELLVPASYTVNITSVEPNGILDAPVPIRISGFLTFKPGLTPRVSAVDVRVQGGKDRLSDVSTISDPLQPGFYVTQYFPRPDDIGKFEVTARHPASTEPEGSRSWSVRGMACTPSHVTWQAFLDTDTVTFRAASTLTNVGVDPITNVTATVVGISGSLTEAYVKQSGNETSQAFFLPDFQAKASVVFDIVAVAANPLRGTLLIVFSSPGGTTTRLLVSLHFSVRSPVLVFSPSSLKVSAVIGKQTLVSAVLRNNGDATATNVTYDIPSDPRERLSVVSFAAVNSSIGQSKRTHLDIQPGGEAILTLAVTLQTSEDIGQMSGRIAVNALLGSGALLPYTIYLTSVARLNLTITVEDEYTYFAAGAPLVSGATVRLVNPRQPYSEVLYTTNETGIVTFENILEDLYTLTASADRHGGFSQVIQTDRDKSDMKIFLPRIAVQYTWTVTPTTVEDKYVITLDSTFETRVPMPVITIEPVKVDIVPYELGKKTVIPFRVTNHGLIRADNLRYVLPDHQYLRFESIIEDIGSIEANTTLEVPVKVVLKHRPARDAAGGSVCGLALRYDFVCGGTQSRGLEVTLTRDGPGGRSVPCGGGYLFFGGGGGGLTASGSSSSYNPETPLSCDCAKTLVKSCVIAFIPLPPGVRCVLAAKDLITDLAQGETSNSIDRPLKLLDTAFACVYGVICSVCGTLYTALRCLIDANRSCGPSRLRREVSSEVVYGLIAASKPMENFLQMMADIFGDETMFDIDRIWYTAFKPVVSDDSDDGILLSQSEFNSVLNSLAGDEQKTVLSKFLTRWNTTAAAWQDGTMAELEDTTSVISLERLTPRVQQYMLDENAAKDRGFDSIFDEFSYVLDVYITAERNDQEQGGGHEEGVCAKVRVRIVQELVLTRDAFNARLEIENGETSTLEDIRVEIWIKQTYGSGDLMNDVFGIGSPDLIGISAVDGTGRLGRDLSGSAEWLIIPSSEAAPVEDTLYDVGGRLSYRVGGSNFSVPLLPDTITVKPNPSLVVHYFHEKYVQGDNALTTDVVEPKVPFTLAVMVMNAGYGVARALKITSAQPEIIENEKGLLVSFKIIGAQIGNEPMTASLTVDFGDIASFETKTARWLLTSSLMGTFSNFSATFENINPLGDPQLSLLDELGYHELIHLVRIDTSPDADDLDDFLVDERLNANSLPDKLYNSENGSDVHAVKIANITKFEMSDLQTDSSMIYRYVDLELNASDCQWFYCRIENLLTRFELECNEQLLSVTRDDGREVLVGKNAWQTIHILDKHFFHLLDYDVDGTNNTLTHTYKLKFGPVNETAAKSSVPGSPSTHTTVTSLSPASSPSQTETTPALVTTDSTTGQTEVATIYSSSSSSSSPSSTTYQTSKQPKAESNSLVENWMIPVGVAVFLAIVVTVAVRCRRMRTSTTTDSHEH